MFRSTLELHVIVLCSFAVTSEPNIIYFQFVVKNAIKQGIIRLCINSAKNCWLIGWLHQDNAGTDVLISGDSLEMIAVCRCLLILFKISSK